MSEFYDQNGLPLNVQPQYTAPAQPQYPAPVQPQYAGPIQQKSALLAALLCFFFGIFGVHNFYLGHTNRGVIMLVLSFVVLLTWWMGVGLVILGALLIWELIDFIMLLTKSGPFQRDGRGVPLS
ncbi:TM2 domain-containing protein [Corynebacterium nasicanis]|uniref:NINE protein n=1 Tax=Corynebacterium nasicanis TaxID=1448267 RepID=A0ABW1QDG1_9CORY